VRESPGLHFATEQGWLEVVRAWARTVPEVDLVWVFGSRATGIRRAKEEQAAIPDLDLAYSLAGSDPGSLLGLAVFEEKGWQARLQRQIPVPVQLQLAAEGDEIVMPAVKEHGVMIYKRSET
jgi:hypothetical protein